MPAATGSSAGANGYGRTRLPLKVSLSSPSGVSRFLTIRLAFDAGTPVSQAVAHGGSSSGSGSSRISLGGFSGSCRSSTATVITNGPTGGCTPSQRLTALPRLRLLPNVVLVCPQTQRYGFGLPAMLATLPVIVVPSTGSERATVR